MDDDRLREIMRDELEPVKADVAGLRQHVDQRFDGLEAMLEGVIDKRFPPVDQQRSGGPPPAGGIAAKGAGQ
ncbi:MAG: hypothetical protein OXQ94_18415 [Gemmatimonadota bacterium]|nr:hypothetical protein [Gemmatimonadota bacterium]MDE2873649.1 hypothetical protein [Gemmatimonadota bacterium]